MSNNESRTALYQKFTQAIVRQVSEGVEGSWSLPWDNLPADILHPVNADSGRPYRGVNVLMLWATSLERGFTSGIWGTYRQRQNLGGQVSRGASGTPVVYWDTFTKLDEQGQPMELSFVRHWTVFNRDQVEGSVEGIDAIIPQPDPDWMSFFDALGAKVEWGRGKACYLPSQDRIWMPAKNRFPCDESLAAVLAHEHIHWTGHRSRLDRGLAGRTDKDSYAFEELVAELGAAFVCGHLGLSKEPRPDHAVYVSHWLEVIKAEPKTLFRAAALAQKAVDWLVDASADEAVVEGEELVSLARNTFS